MEERDDQPEGAESIDPPGPAALWQVEGIAALDHLVQVATTDLRVRQFLLSWWGAKKAGGWDPTDLWMLELGVLGSVLKVLTLIAARPGAYADSYGHGEQMRAWMVEHLPPPQKRRVN